jgi:nucleoside-diphosphate-sugar epimerase
MRGGVAVLGAGGFVGARLLEMAALGGHTDIVPVVRNFRSVARSANLDVSHRIADTSQHESLVRAFDGCDAVVNLTVGATSEIVRTTENIHRATRAAGARLLIHISSATVFGEIERPDLPDDAPPRAGHWMPYAREKGRAEDFLRARMGDSEVTVVVLRPSLIWGPGSPWVLGPASEIIRGTAYLVGGGAGICDLMYVDDLVRSIHAVRAHPAPTSGFFHVADDVTPTWRDYYAALAEGLGVDPATIHQLPAGRYRPGLRDRLEVIRGLRAYGWLKERMSLETRTHLKVRLAQARGRDGGPSPASAARPVVTRTMWELQSTRYRLPTAKFRSAFGPLDRASFASSIAASLAWLRFIGVDERDSAAPRRASSAPALVARET